MPPDTNAGAGSRNNTPDILLTLKIAVHIIPPANTKHSHHFFILFRGSGTGLFHHKLLPAGIKMQDAAGKLSSYMQNNGRHLLENGKCAEHNAPEPVGCGTKSV
jgi:hypothetical protein